MIDKQPEGEAEPPDTVGVPADGGAGTGVLEEALREPEHAEARQRAAGGDHAGAAELYAGAVESNPSDVAALLGLGAALLALGRYEAAEREIRRAIRVAPDRPDVQLQLGVVLHRRAVYPAAATALRRAVELDPRGGPALLPLGETLNQMGESAAAIEALQRCVDIEPSARGFYALGIAHDRMGEPDRASELYRRARALNGR
jgi:tetratricopeptide (TPR) repeat protein